MRASVRPDVDVNLRKCMQPRIRLSRKDRRDGMRIAVKKEKLTQPVTSDCDDGSFICSFSSSIPNHLIGISPFSRLSRSLALALFNSHSSKSMSTLLSPLSSRDHREGERGRGSRQTAEPSHLFDVVHIFLEDLDALIVQCRDLTPEKAASLNATRKRTHS